ncbi:hypothetical protein DFP72DRAFT_858678 [Ephemerocybe angulata]|uniref:Uncharacterized protein n=1 Tax=Ephemerocybe angulata TaxID=980116 RepID=A0A8H6HC98_9AGAR|nr:hypothetical protein DFP72DRAFT_858678 [Tulosesus angulatus]
MWMDAPHLSAVAISHSPRDFRNQDDGAVPHFEEHERTYHFRGYCLTCKKYIKKNAYPSRLHPTSVRTAVLLVQRMHRRGIAELKSPFQASEITSTGGSEVKTVAERLIRTYAYAVHLLNSKVSKYRLNYDSRGIWRGMGGNSAVPLVTALAESPTCSLSPTLCLHMGQNHHAPLSRFPQVTAPSPFRPKPPLILDYRTRALVLIVADFTFTEDDKSVNGHKIGARNTMLRAVRHSHRGYDPFRKFPSQQLIKTCHSFGNHRRNRYLDDLW